MLGANRGWAEREALLDARWAVPVLEGMTAQLSVYNVTGSPAADPVPGDYAPITSVRQIGPQARLPAEYRF